MQAQKLVKVLRKNRVEAIYSSPERRAQQN